MKRLERIRLIKYIADRLSCEQWPIIFIILQHFSLPMEKASEWGDDTFGYVVQMISSASEDILKELSEYYEKESSAVRHIPDHKRVFEVPDFWEKGLYRMFISHRSRYKEEVIKLQSALSCCGISAFVAHVDIRPSKAWLEQIELALKTCDGLLAYLTPDFHESEWTDQEVGFALARGIRIIPLDRGKLPYGLMGKYQALKTGALKDIQVAVKTMKLVMSDPRSGPSFPDLLIQKLEESVHFSTSTMLMTALEALPVLEEKHFVRIDRVYESNAQFSGVRGMKTRLKRLHQKFEKVPA
jgi:hypothetical protein